MTAADDRYALPLAVSVRSLIDHLGPRSRLRLYVLDGGISRRHRRMLLDSWDLRGTEVRWVRPSASALRGVPNSKRFGLASYFRLLIPEILPATTRRAIYLDADTLVLDDVSRLWRTGLRRKAVGAVQDPLVRSLKHSSIPREDVRAPLSAGYFNSGVLLLDLTLWRKRRLSQEVIAYLRRRRRQVVFPDQDALNAVLAARWQPLDLRWNLGVEARFYPMMTVPFRERLRVARATAYPAILHFIAGPKPWQKRCASRRLLLYYHYLDRTQWAGWRPD